MNVTTSIQKAYLEATGKATPPSVGSNKYNRLLSLADDLQKTWQAEQGVDWYSLYDPLVSLGTVTATNTFAIPSTVRKLSTQEGDFVSIVDGSSTWYYTLVPPTRLQTFYAPDSDTYVWGWSSKVAARIGSNLKFATAFSASDTQIGGTLYVPGYLYVDDITAGADIVQVDDPMWLVYMMAAEYVRNDTVRQGQYGNLVAKASDRMEAMKRDSGTQLDQVPNLMDMYGTGISW